MVHAFEMKGRYIAYDSESCALHELDQTAFLSLCSYIENEGKRPVNERLEKIAAECGLPNEEILSVCDDIDELIQEGELFSEGQRVNLDDLYPDDPAVKAMCLHICHDCNLRCKYCFAGTGDYHTGKRSMLDDQTGKQAIDFLIASSGERHNLDIDFFGGEPLMNWPVVMSLTEYCEKRAAETGKDIRLTITTNALLLDEEKTKYINEHMKNCVLSIDGRPEVHDNMRPAPNGSGSYRIVSDRIRTFLAARTSADSKYYEHYVRGTYTRSNLDFSQDVIHLAEELGARHISVEPVVSDEDSFYRIRPEDLPEIEREYENLAEYLIRKKADGDPVHFFHFLMDMQGGPCLYKRLKGCGVGAEYCAVTPDGDIYPCHQFTGEIEWKMGNVRDVETLLDENRNLLPGKKTEEILNSRVRQIFIDRLMPDKAECRSCFARYHCGGGCPANSFHATGSLDGQYEIGCALAKKRLECSLWMTVVGQDT